MSPFSIRFERVETRRQRQDALRAQNAEIRKRAAVICRDDPRWFEDVATELERRLQLMELSLPSRTRSRKDKWPDQCVDPMITRNVHPIDIMIVRALARTWGAVQFGCSPNGEVFTADTDGHSLGTIRRDDITGVSALLDEAADIFNTHKRHGRGGRFYERGGCFFDADDGVIFLAVDARCDTALDYWKQSHKGILPRIAALLRN